MQFSCLPSSRNPASSTSRINFCKAFATAEYSRARGKNYAPFMESNRRARVPGAVTGRAAGIPAVARRFPGPRRTGAAFMHARETRARSRA